MKKEMLKCMLNMEFYCKSKEDLSGVLKNVLDIINVKVRSDEVYICDVDKWNTSCVYASYGKELDWYLSVFSSEIDITDEDDIAKKLKKFTVNNDLSCLVEPVWDKLENSTEDLVSVIVKLGYDRALNDVYITFFYCTREEDIGGL